MLDCSWSLKRIFRLTDDTPPPPNSSPFSKPCLLTFFFFIRLPIYFLGSYRCELASSPPAQNSDLRPSISLPQLEEAPSNFHVALNFSLSPLLLLFFISLSKGGGGLLKSWPASFHFPVFTSFHILGPFQGSISTPWIRLKAVKVSQTPPPARRVPTCVSKSLRMSFCL